MASKNSNQESALTQIDARIEEARKLQITGGSTFILSLPKMWVTKNELRRGSSIIVRQEDDGSLCIMPSGLPKKEKQDEAYIKALPTSNADAIMRTAISAYLNGYNILHIKTNENKVLSTKLRNRLKTFARNYLVGTEIVIDSPTDLRLQVLLNYPELTVNNALSRMSIIASSMHKESIAALKTLDYQSAKGVIETDREVNRFGLYIIRLLKLAVSNPRIVKEIGLHNQKDCLGYRMIARAVERTADHATKVSENTLELKEAISDPLAKKIDELSAQAVCMFENSVQALFTRDYDLAESIIEKVGEARRIEKEAVFLTQTQKIEEIVNLRLIIESVRRTAEYASDISEVVLNLNVESALK